MITCIPELTFGHILFVNDFQAIFFGGIDEYLRREIWPFLLHYFAFDSTLEERNAQRGEKREEYEAIKQKRYVMTKRVALGLYSTTPLKYPKEGT